MNNKDKKSDTTPAPASPVAHRQEDKWPWGAISTIGLAIIIFIGPQILLALLIPESLINFLEDISENVFNFSYLVLAEIISFIFLYLILQGRHKTLKDIYLGVPKLSQLLMAIPAFGGYLIISVSMLIGASYFLTDERLDEEQDIGFESVDSSNVEMIMIFIGLVLIIPIIEELLFRGFVLRGLVSKLGWPVGAVLSSLLFGLAHFQLNVSLDTFALALVASWLVYETRSLWSSILLHALKNSIAFAALFNFINI